MKIHFSIDARDALTMPDTNTALLQKIEALGHTLDPEITKIIRHPTTSHKLKQDAFKYLFRSMGVTKLETMHDDAAQCHRFTLHFPDKEPATITP